MTHVDPPDRQGPRLHEPLVYALTGHRGAIRAVAVTPDGKRAVSGSDDTTLKLWDLERGQELTTMTGHAMTVWSVAITPDGKCVISGSSDGTLKVWDLELGRERTTMTGHAGTVWSVVVTPDGRRAVAGSRDGTLKEWDLERGQEIRTISHGPSSVWAVAVTPDGKWLVAGARDGTAELWALDGGKAWATASPIDRMPLEGIIWRTGSIRSLAVVPRDSEKVSRQPWVAWDLRTTQEFTILVSDNRARVVTPDGRRMVEAGDMLTLWDVAQKRIRATRTGHSGKVWAVTVTPDGKCAVSGGHDRTLRIWDLERVSEPLVPLTPEALRSLNSPRSLRPRSLHRWDGELRSRGGFSGRDVLLGASETPKGVRSDPVRLGASAPRKVRPGQEFTARLAAYDLALLRQARKALRQHGARIHMNLAETRWKLGGKVRVTLAGMHLVVEPAVQEFVWEGKLHAVDFDARVIGDFEEDTDTRLKFDVFLVGVPDCEAVPVARLRLPLTIRPRRNWLGRLFPTRVQFAAQPAFQSAFASYDTADWPDVLIRLDAIQQHTGMQFFYECLSRGPREKRKSFLAAQIAEQDLFLLFWSRHAAVSSAVEWEWRTALDLKGLDAMQAQRLEPEPLLPAELESLETVVSQNLPALEHALAAGSMPRKSTLLFLAASPAPTEHRALDQEARDIAAKIRAAEHRDALLFHTRWAVRLDDLLQALNEDHPAVVHFSGHGTGEHGIVLHDDLGVARLVTAEALKRLFSALQGEVRLVVLNACYSEGQAIALAEVIDCVVGMSDRIGDQRARVFVASFYRALGFGRSVRNAFDQGLAALALESLETEQIHGPRPTPTLHVRNGVDPGRVHIVTVSG